MNERPQPASTRRRDLGLIALFAALLFLPGLGGRDVWNPDEPRYGQVAREMRATGEYLVPHYNGRLYTQKPPLMFWAMAASGALLGELDEWAVRLPSALAAIGSVLLVYVLGRKLFDRRAAWLAAVVFATCSKTLWQARVGQIDMLLTFLVLCAVYWWISGRIEALPTRNPQPARPAFSYLFFLFAGLATLAKGPVGLLPPLLSILVFLAVTRDRQGLRDLRLGRGLLIWAGVVALWLVPAIVRGGEAYTDDILLKQNVTRYVDPWGHHRPFWYFAQMLPVDFLPWSLFVPAAIGASRTLDAQRRRHLLFLGLWVIVTVIFFSVSPGKRTVYIFTCYPALALLTGTGLAALSRVKRAERSWVAWLAWPAGFFALLLWIVSFAAPSASRWVEIPEFAQPLLLPVAIAIGVLAAAATAAFVLALRQRVVPMVAALALGLAITTLPLFLWIAPRLNAGLSLRVLAEIVRRDLPPGYTLASLHEMEGGLLFYGVGPAREIENGEELAALRASGESFWLIVDPDDREGIEWPPDLPEVARQNDTDDSVMVFGWPMGVRGGGRSTAVPSSASRSTPGAGR